MRLSDPAEKLWLAYRNVLHRIAADESEPSALVLGGANILQGEWNHRQSVDIDLLLPDRRNVTDLHPGRRLDLARAVDGKVVTKTEYRIVVQTPQGVLDITTMQPPLRGIEHNVKLAGADETVLRPSQILRGKLNRIHNAFDRDAFDLITSEKADPVGLEIAVNSLDADSRAKAKEHLKSRDRRQAIDWAHELFRVPAEYRRPLATIGTEAAEALTRHEYVRVQIHRLENTTMVLAVPRHGTPRSLKMDGEPKQAICKSGMQDYLDNNTTVSSFEVEQALQRLIDRNATGLVLDTTDDDPRERVDRILRNAVQNRNGHAIEESDNRQTSREPAKSNVYNGPLARPGQMLKGGNIIGTQAGDRPSATTKPRKAGIEHDNTRKKNPYEL